MLYYFSYSDHPEEGVADESTAFISYNEGSVAHDSEKLQRLFGGFKRRNYESLAAVLEQGRERNAFAFNESFPANVNYGAIGTITQKLEIKEQKD